MNAAPPQNPGFQLPTRRLLVLAAFVAVVFWFARPVLLPFAVATVIAYAFSPYIDIVQAKTGRSRTLIVVLCYGTALVIIGAIVLALAGPVSHELALLIQAGPNALDVALRQLLGGDSITIGNNVFTVGEIRSQLEAAIRNVLQTPEGAIRAASQLLQGTLDTILVVIVTFYLLLDGGRFAATALRFLDPRDRAEVVRVSRTVHTVVGRWLRGQLVLVVFVSTVVTVVFATVLHLPYPLGLGVLVGALEVITYIGPIIAGVIVAIVALSSGGIGLAAASVVFLFVLRQLEDVLIMPNVLGRAVNLHPLVALFAVVVGTTAFGIIGTFLAVPVAAGINVALHEFYPRQFSPEADETSQADAASRAERAADAAPSTGPSRADGS
ncbi:MAG TPA: AI-2E family transporter [Candidatus Limnocylindrales bacterium]